MMKIDRGAALAEPADCLVGDAHVARRQIGAVEEHRFAADVACQGDVGIAAKPDIDRLEIEAAGGRATAAVGGLGGLELQRLPGGGGRHRPGLRNPLRREVDDLLADVGHAERTELLQHPLRVLGVGRGADDPSPELRVAIVAIATGDLRELLDVALQARAGNRGVLLVGRSKAPADLGMAHMRLTLRMADRSQGECDGERHEDDQSVFPHSRLRAIR